MSCMQHCCNPKETWGCELSPCPSLSLKGEQASTWPEYLVLQYGWLQGSGKIGNGLSVCVCVQGVCEIAQTCVRIIAQRRCAMQWINVALCQAAATVSLPPFFSFLSFSCSLLLSPAFFHTGYSQQRSNCEIRQFLPLSLKLLLWRK